VASSPTCGEDGRGTREGGEWEAGRAGAGAQRSRGTRDARYDSILETARGGGTDNHLGCTGCFHRVHPFTRRSTTMIPLTRLRLYAPNVGEGKFCEVELPLYGVLRSSTPDTQATLARAWIRFIRFSLVQEAIVHRSEAALPVLPLALS
jgi:hypothetical protein